MVTIDGETQEITCTVCQITIHKNPMSLDDFSILAASFVLKHCKCQHFQKSTV